MKDHVVEDIKINGDKNSFSEKTFEDIKHTNENLQEFWYARELQAILEYTKWENFSNVINKAKEACVNSGNELSDHFPEVRKMVNIGSGAGRDVEDYMLSRYACYLIVQNGDPSKDLIALGQTYFAIKTRQQELIDGYNQLTEEQKDIHKRKGLKKNQKILDHMGSTELAANLFRATQTDDKLRRENIQGKEKANETHFEVGKKVRNTIRELGGNMPENFETPEKSVRQIKKKHNELTETE